MALGVVEILVARKRDEAVRGKWRLVLVEFNGEFTLIGGDYRGVGLSGFEAVARCLLKRCRTGFTAVSGRTRGVTGDSTTFNLRWCSSGQGGIACAG